MTRLEERIAKCHDLATHAESIELCDAYIAEMVGLCGNDLWDTYEPYRHAYECGLSDRATLLKLEE